MKLREIGTRVRSYFKYRKNYDDFAGLQAANPDGFPPLRREDRMRILGEDTKTTGFDRHYVYHTAWAARVLSQTSETPHYDFGSLLYFSTMVSAFRPVRFYDYRPAEIELAGLESEHADLTNLPMADGSVSSASCMHVLEHIGLGRYGDPIDPAGDRKAADELQRIVAPGGDLLIVVPVGTPRVCFNGHRIYSHDLLTKRFDRCEVVELSLITDHGPGPAMVAHADPALVAQQEYGCGCYWFRKR